MQTPSRLVSRFPAARASRKSDLRPAWVLSLALLGAASSASAWAHSVGGKSDEDLALAHLVQASQGQVNLSGWLSYVGNDPRARMIALPVPGVTTVTSHFKSWSSGADPRLPAR